MNITEQDGPDYDIKAVEELDTQIFNMKINLSSPLNSGYELEFYKDQLQKALELKRRRGIQLQFDF
jgi:hypothetical protein